MKKISFKDFIPHIVAFLIFIVITFGYMSPLIEGKRLKQGDRINHIGMSKEIADFRKEHNEEPLWTNSMFGGMPAFQISVLYPSNLVQYVDKIIRLGLPRPADYVFLYLIGFYFLLLVLGVDPWLSIGGAIAFAFSSYFFIILEAGHNTKAHAIGYMAPIIASVIITFRGRYMLGAILTALFIALQLKCNHPQITYYTGFIVFILGVGELAKTIKEKTITQFIKTIGILVIAAILALGTNITSLWTTLEYSTYTIRGKSELTSNQEDKTSGLDKSYATAWSYGLQETFSLMIPNVKGGASGYLGQNKKAMDKVEPQLRQNIAQSSHYWGAMPFTSGPVYVGAIIAFLFILGLLIVKGRLKWVLMASTVVSILLAWGHNFNWLTDMFLDHFPGYNKFRTVSMILVIAQLAMPLLAMLALAKILKEPKIIKVRRKQFFWALGLTGGLSLIFYLLPDMFFGFISSQEAKSFDEYRSTNPQQVQQINAYVANLELARITIFKGDAIRTFFFVLLTGALVWFYSMKTYGKPVFIAVFIILILIDMGVVNKRYLNNDNFVSKRQIENPFHATDVDIMIKQDADPNFRVFNSTVRPDQDSRTSYFHKSLGGYHGAKFKRYQELIDYHINKRNISVFNMLNTKYFIVQDKDKQMQVQRNVSALGNVWFVQDFRMVENADSEIVALDNFDPATTVIIDKRYGKYLEDFTIGIDSGATIELTNYLPNNLKYQSNSSIGQLAVFSEIYYDKGWNAYVDGKILPHFRVNYVLRGMIIPAGSHEIEFKFEPKSYYTGEKISLASSILLLILFLGVCAFEIRKRYFVKNE